MVLQATREAILKYHERDDYAAEPTALAAVAETIDCEPVVAYTR